MSDQRDAVLNEEHLAGQARGWLVLLRSGRATQGDIRRLSAWRARSSAHAEAFRQAVALWDLLGPALEAAAEPTPLRRSFAPVAVSRRAAIGGGMAIAAGVGAVAFLAPGWADGGGKAYATDKGETRRVALAGNGDMLVNTNTRVIVDEQAGECRMRLARGEILLRLAYSGPRRLIVTAGDHAATATDATFTVLRDGRRVRVLCLRGAIDLSRNGEAIALKANDAYESRGGEGEVLRGADVQTAAAWRTGVVIFDNDALSEVIAELNRYREGRIILANRDLANLRVHGVFHLRNPDQAVSHIARSLNVPMRRLPAGVVVLG